MIIGIDEVGRGPIAGPVCVAAFLVRRPGQFARELELLKKKHRLPLRDSKKLSKKDREAWVQIAQELKTKGKCDYAVSVIQATTIDRIGIVPSIRRALANSLTKVATSGGASFSCHIVLDGGLRAPIQYKKQTTIIKGDEKEISIALASIVAKVHRDKIMVKMAKKYPGFGFESHVGYGTRAHYSALRRYGTTQLHRKTFIK
jgi:ribonuclease HII